MSKQSNKLECTRCVLVIQVSIVVLFQSVDTSCTIDWRCQRV